MNASRREIARGCALRPAPHPLEFADASLPDVSTALICRAIGWVNFMLKLQWSDIFPPAAGRLGRKDYLVALFKLAMAYLLGVKIGSVLVAIVTKWSGFGESANPFGSPQAAALVQVILFWPVLTLVSRRMADVKKSVREKYWVWRYTFPAALFLLVGAHVLAALGLQRFVNLELVSALGPLVPIVLITAGFLTPEPLSNEVLKLQTGPADEPAFAALARTIAAKPAGFSPKPNVRSPARQAPQRQQAPAGPSAVQRTYRLPQQGRVKAGWFN
jgi:uncharacterized membrane protein YhaH (DUF805 family)